MAGPHFFLQVHVNNGASMVDPGSVLHISLVVAWTTLQPLQAMSKQPTLLLSLDLLTEARVSAPSPRGH